MSRSSQQHFFRELGLKANAETIHGGEASNFGRRKVRRPLDPKKALHLVLRSSVAKSELSLLKSDRRQWIEKLIYRKAQRFGVKIHSYANVGNHLHLLLRFKKRPAFQNFLRSITALIARKVSGAKKGKSFGKFWDSLAFTRVMRSLREWTNCVDYINANRVEAFAGRENREMYLAWVADEKAKGS